MHEPLNVSPEFLTAYSEQIAENIAVSQRLVYQIARKPPVAASSEYMAEWNFRRESLEAELAITSARLADFRAALRDVIASSDDEAIRRMSSVGRYEPRSDGGQ